MKVVDKVMHTEQYNSLAKLINDIKKRCRNIAVIVHKEKFATVCLGKNFPLVKLRCVLNR